MNGEPRVQCAQAAQSKKAIERRACETQAIRPPGKLIMEFLALRHHGATDHIAMTVNVLGGRVQNNIRTMAKWLLPRGRQEGIVDNHQRPHLSGQRRNGADVCNAQQWVARRFDPH